VPPR
jgi:hypothetical protein